MNAQFGVTWGDPLLYDLVLNTDRVSVESCAEQIAALAAAARVRRRPSVARDAAEPGARGARPRRAARRRGDDGRRRQRSTSSAGRVVLTGMVLNADEMPAAERVASRVPGVGERRQPAARHGAVAPLSAGLSPPAPPARAPLRSCRAASAGSASPPRGSGRRPAPSSGCARRARGACAGSACTRPGASSRCSVMVCAMISLIRCITSYSKVA